MPNSWRARIQPWAPLVEATAVVLTLLFTALYAVPQLRNASTQLRQAQTALEENVRVSLRQQQLEVNTLIVDNPELYPYFYQGRRVLARHFGKAHAVAEIILVHFQDLDFLLKSETFRGNRRAFDLYMATRFEQSPVLCEQLVATQFFRPVLARNSIDFCKKWVAMDQWKVGSPPSTSSGATGSSSDTTPPTQTYAPTSAPPTTEQEFDPTYAPTTK